MADHKNKLEDFFKNRINDFNSTEDGWDLPDETIWENAQTQFPIHPQKKDWDWKLGALILLAFMLVLSGSYIYFLKKNLTQKSNEIEFVQSEIENKNNTITNLEKEVARIESELNQEKLSTKNTSNSYSQEQELSTKTILSQRRSIQNLENENQGLKQELITVQANFAAKNKSSISPNKNSVSNFSNNSSKEVLENVAPITVSSMEIQNDFPIKKLDLKDEYKVIFPKPKKEKGKFEFGLSYSLLNFEIPLAYDFEKLEKEDFGKDELTFAINSKGGIFQMAYAIRPNFWITTGIRRTSVSFEESFSDKLIYNKSGEYLDDEGKTINEFEITTQTGFSDVGSKIDFEIPNGTVIDDGDFLATEWNYSQQYKFTHIPIGVNYFMGKNKLKWFFTGGFGWNKVSLGEYFVEAQLSYDNEILPIKQNEESKKNKVSSQFINGFAGAGLNYQLTPNWNARTSFTLEKNFIQKNEILESNSLSKVFDIGLNFRF